MLAPNQSALAVSVANWDLFSLGLYCLPYLDFDSVFFGLQPLLFRTTAWKLALAREEIGDDGGELLPQLRSQIVSLPD